MKQKSLGLLLLFGIFLTGCGRVEDGRIETSGVPETLEASGISGESETAGITEQDADKESVSSDGGDSEVETVEYSYEEFYLSVDIPSGWEYEIRTAEELAKEDGVIICGIDFWSAEFPDTVFELGYQSFFGMCGTGVTIEDFTLDNGLGGYRYTEEIGDTLWLTISLNNPSDNLSGGSYLISASLELTVWDTLQSEFEQILNSVWVGSRAEE